MPHTIICQSTDHANDESSSTDSLCATSNTIVRVLPQEAGILFVNTDHVLDDDCITAMPDI
jgi:type II secretory pathway component HofQ